MMRVTCLMVLVSAACVAAQSEDGSGDAADQCVVQCKVCLTPFGDDCDGVQKKAVALVEKLSNKTEEESAAILTAFAANNWEAVGLIKDMTDGNGLKCTDTSAAGCFLSCFPVAAQGLFNGKLGTNCSEIKAAAPTNGTKTVVKTTNVYIAGKVYTLTYTIAYNPERRRSTGLDFSNMSKEDYATTKDTYKTYAAETSGVALDEIKTINFYKEGTLIPEPTVRRGRRAAGDITMEVVFKEGYTEAEALKAAATFNAAPKTPVTLKLADGTTYTSTFESVEVKTEAIPFTCDKFTADYVAANKELVTMTKSEKQGMLDMAKATKLSICPDAFSSVAECTEATKCLADAQNLLNGVTPPAASAAGLYSGVAVLTAVVASTLF